jgi:hypothetical protein
MRSILILLCLVLGLGYADQQLGKRAAAERESRARVGRFLDKAEVSEWSVSCFEVSNTLGQNFLYLPYFGRWRCRSHNGAPVETQAIEALYLSLTEGEGIVLDEQPRDSANYGIGTATGWRVTFHGEAALQRPHSDPIVSFEIGDVVEGRQAVYVRRVGESRVWLLETNPRAALDAPTAAGLPPLLTPYLVPGDWSGWEQGLARVTLEDAGRTRYVLEKRVPPLTGGGDPRERPSFIWVLDPGLSESMAAQLQSMAFTFFLQRVPYLDVLGPRDRTGLGLDAPTRTLVLQPASGPPLRLGIGTPLPDGRVPLWNGETERAYLVSGEVGTLLTPPREVFTTASDQNPWDPYLR